MTPLTSEWVEKAEEDYAAAVLLQSHERPLHGAVCFHAQQCAEKYLKARLQEAGMAFRKTHDLTELLDSLVPLEPLLQALGPGLNRLSAAAVEARYPGIAPTREQAAETMEVCVQTRSLLRKSLHLPD